jgi:hypothetical protein
MPDGRKLMSRIAPTGSGSAATWRRPTIMPSMRAGSAPGVPAGWLQTIGAAGGQILFVGCGQLGARSVQRIGSSLQGAVFLRGAGTADDPEASRAARPKRVM